jgi:hypothetical protein
MICPPGPFLGIEDALGIYLVLKAGEKRSRAGFRGRPAPGMESMGRGLGPKPAFRG